MGVSVLMALIFSKYFYLASMTSYYTFYLIHRFHTSIQVFKFSFIFLLGGAWDDPGGLIGDRFGRKIVICVNRGVAPFSLLLLHVGLLWVGVLSKDLSTWPRPFGHPGLCPGTDSG
jgi:FSR family fosmidomycin resistance protein-like MFS transporter